MSGDPVLDAVRRARSRVSNGMANVTLSFMAEVGADEALKPLRDMHRPFATNDPRSPYDVVCNHCLGPKKWPCPTALYLYSTEELQ